MRDYAFDDYGLLLTEETLKILASKIVIAKGEEYSDELYENDPEFYNDLVTDELDIEYNSEFTGEATLVKENGAEDWDDSITFNNDILRYVRVDKYPNLFRAAYNSIDDVVEEFKAKLGEYLPDDFDYKANFRHIVGTYYG
jgi:hypothetical protein